MFSAHISAFSQECDVEVYLHWAASQGLRLPNTRRGLRWQGGPECVDLQYKTQLIKPQQKKVLEKMIGMKRKPFLKVPKAITTCTLTQFL